MSARQLAIVLLRVAGVYLIIQVVAALPAGLWSLGYLVESMRHDRSVAAGITWERWSQVAFTVWPVIVYGAAGIGVLAGAPRLASRVVPGETRSARVVIGRRLQATAITVLGVAVLAGAAPRVALTLVTLAMTARFERIPGTITDTVAWPALLELGVTLAVGLYLCIGARGLSNAIQSLRAPRAVNGDTPNSRLTPT